MGSDNKVTLIIEGPDYKLESTDEFSSSYFQNEYQQAAYVVGDIVNKTLKNRRCSKDGNRIEVQNIVPFIGKRGSGKTSAMMSFANSLKEYKYKDMAKDGEEKGIIAKALRTSCRNTQIRFTVLDSIDGSLLEKDEDVFKIVLAQLYVQYELCKDKGDFRQNEKHEYERHALLQAFDRVYRSSCKMEAGNMSNYEESSLASLKNISNSLTLKSEFDFLIQRYLEYASGIEREENRCNAASEQFLVVVIDDIDMNIENGFDMLEKIHRYMMVRNVIVLLAMDYDQMKTLCQHSFYEMVPKYDMKMREKDADVERLAQEYLDKVLPANERVYITGLNKYSDILIKKDTDSESVEGKDVKKTVFTLMWAKLGMRLDVMGSKRHFYEQNSLRSFVNFYLMLEGMEDIEPDDYDLVERILAKNYKILMSDTTTRMINERLNSYYTKSFHRITEIGIPHSMRNLYFEMIKMEDKNKDEILFLPDLKENLRHFGYSYGEVLRIIYCWGRVNEQSKEMIRCLLAFYSLELINEYHKYCLAAMKKDHLAKSKAKGCLADVLNGSFAGSWANRMLPRVNIDARLHAAGARTEVKIENVFRLHFQLKKNRVVEGKIARREVLGEKREEIRKVFRSVTVLAMFFEQKHYKAERSLFWQFCTQERSESEGELQTLFPELSSGQKLSFSVRGGTGTFNVFGFVANQLDYEGIYGPLWGELDELLFGEKETAARAAGHAQRVNNCINNIIGRDFTKWYEYSKGFAMPVYDIDLCYNIMKRLRQRDTANLDITLEELLPRIRGIYDFIEWKLRENDEWYRENVGELVSFKNFEENGSYADCCRISFADAFANCPFIKWIRDKESLMDNFDELFMEMFRYLVAPGNSKIPRSLGGGNEIHGYDD